VRVRGRADSVISMDGAGHSRADTVTQRHIVSISVVLHVPVALGM